MKSRLIFVLIAALLLLGAVSTVSAQGEIDVLTRLLQTPESTLALVALVLGVISITVFVRANAKATQEADRITNRILDQYEKSAIAAVKNATAQADVARGIHDMVAVMKTEFASMRDAQDKQAEAIRAQATAILQNTHDMKAYQTLVDDTVDGLRQSVLALVSRIGAIEERTEQISLKAANAPGDHAKIISLLEALTTTTREQQTELLAYLNERRGDNKDAIA